MALGSWLVGSSEASIVGVQNMGITKKQRSQGVKRSGMCSFICGSWGIDRFRKIPSFILMLNVPRTRLRFPRGLDLVDVELQMNPGSLF